jgi:hypothetical protein
MMGGATMAAVAVAPVLSLSRRLDDGRLSKEDEENEENDDAGGGGG